MKQAWRIILSYLVVALVFLGCDFVWIGSNSAWLYQPVLGPHMAARYDWSAVAVFYPLYFIGVLFFVVRPWEELKCRTTFLHGLLFGIVAYATYDLTNQATLSGWPWHLSLIDMGWGGAVTGISSTLARGVLNKMKRRGEETASR